MSDDLITRETGVRGARIVSETTGWGPHLIWGHGLSMTMVSDAEMALVDWSRVPATVVRYDARGHGRSESTADLHAYSWAELAMDQLGLADELGITTYVAAGASMGCGTALHVATLAPNRLRGLVLVIPPTAWETRAAQAEQWQQSAVVIESEGVEALVAARAELDLPDPYKSDPDRRRQQAEATRAWDPARLALVMRGAATADLPDRSAIAAIRLPTLVLAWTGDPIHPLSTAEELTALIPESSIHIASSRSDLALWSGLVADFVAGLP